MQAPGLPFFGLATLIPLLALGCDPAGPGASGAIVLGPNVDAKKFATLEVRTYPDSSDTFDPSKIPSSDATTGAQLSEPLKSITFPYHYDAGQVIGTTDEQRWRMTAWLSASTGPMAPAMGEPTCSVAFKLNECGAQFGGYCGTRDNIDCQLE